MPLIATRGAASAQGFGEFAQSGPVNYIEDVFSTYLYTGNASNNSTNNGIDLSTKGGLVWIKSRGGAYGLFSNLLFDSARGPTNSLITNSTAYQNRNASNTANLPQQMTSFNTNGFTPENSSTEINYLDTTYVSWTFRKQAKFFDVVTWTGNGSSNRQISHNLGSTAGFVVVKCTSTGTTGWVAVHRNDGTNTRVLMLNITGGAVFNLTSPTDTAYPVNIGTSTYFLVNGSWDTYTPFSGSGTMSTNTNGETYVAYVFAHNAGGFGASGADNVISCGSFTCNGSGIGTVSLGYEPQWVLAKPIDGGGGDWRMLDNMRGWTNNSAGNQSGLTANTANAETTYGWGDTLSATGFNMYGSASQQFLYITVRRGPMKTPTVGTSVFSPVLNNGTDTSKQINAGFTPDMFISKSRQAIASWVGDRLRGNGAYVTTSSTAAEATSGVLNGGFTQGQTGVNVHTDSWLNAAPYTYVDWIFRRAPGFMDVVCYTGTNSGTLTNTHNLGVTPELMIGKNRGSMTNNTNWYVYHKDIVNSGYLNLTGAFTDSWRIGNPTATTFDVRGTNDLSTALNYSTTYLAYLFASCPGVSKVGSYTGNGSSQTINCGFTSGVRFLMIKNTSTGGTDWQVWDTARGITAGNDPVLYLNGALAEVNSDFISQASTGFTLNNGDSQYNANGSIYIFLAIA